MTVAKVRIGIFAGIFNEEGKLLLRRRNQRNSNNPGESFEGDWELPGGGVEETNNEQALDERMIGAELAREVEEEIGISVSVSFMPMMFPTVSKGGGDWAFVIPLGTCDKRPSTGEIKYVSPQELKALAGRPKGEQLLSGWGKRMSRMALIALCYSPNLRYGNQAQRMLAEIQEERANELEA